MILQLQSFEVGGFVLQAVLTQTTVPSLANLLMSNTPTV